MVPVGVGVGQSEFVGRRGVAGVAGGGGGPHGDAGDEVAEGFEVGAQLGAGARVEGVAEFEEGVQGAVAQGVGRVDGFLEGEVGGLRSAGRG